MSASEQLVKIGEGRKLHLLASYLMTQPKPVRRVHGRAVCGAKGPIRSRSELGLDVLEQLEACPQCTKVAMQAGEWLRDHERIFGGRDGR